MRFWIPPFRTGNEKDILENLLRISDNVYKSVLSMDNSVKAFVEGRWETVEKELKNCSEFEEKADRIRRLLQRMLYTEGFLPFSREDYFNLSESIDNIADQAQKAGFWMSFKKIKVPKKIALELVQLSDKCLKTVERLKGIMDNLGSKSKNIIQETQKVDQERQEVRKIAKSLGKLIFSADHMESYMLWELVYRIMSVADRAEETADRIITITIKMIE